MTDCPNANFLSYSQTSEIEILHRVYTHLIEMLEARKYTIDEEDIADKKELSTFKDLFEDENDPDISILQFVCEKIEEEKETERIAIFWSDVEKIGVRQIKSYLDFMDENDVNHSILILKKPITTFGKRAIEEFNINFPSKYIEYFEYSELLINITKHVLTPLHILLSDTEKAELLKNYNLKKDGQLPKLHHTDAIAKYYGLRKGNVVKVIRQSGSETNYITYRVVV
jgi:DNA-directed RNA polymerase I, II, and III subunit RPABC1